MTQEYSPDPTPARADDGVSTARAHFGAPTTVTTKKRRPPQRRGTLGGSPPRVRSSLPRRQPLAYLSDSRGLTFLGAVILAALIGTIGGVISARSHGWVGTVFTVCFVAGCVLAAILVHREDLLTVAFMPPLLYVATATAVGVGQAVMTSGSMTKKVEFQVGYAMSYGATTMWYATIATAVVVLVMFFVRRASRPMSRPSSIPSYTATAQEQEPSQPQATPTVDPPSPYSPGLG